MRVNEFTNKNKNSNNLFEVNMSPSALKSFINTTFAQSMIVGFEAEIIVPDLVDLSSKIEKPDLSKDEPFPLTEDWKLIFETWYKAGNKGDNDKWVQYALSDFIRELHRYAFNFIKKYISTKTGLKELRILVGKCHKTNDDDVISNDILIQEYYYNMAFLEIQYNNMYKSKNIFVKFINSLKIKTMNDFCKYTILDFPYIINEYTKGTLTHEELVANFVAATGYRATNGDEYHSVVREPGLWIFEPDGSLTDQTDKGNGIELVSPPMALAESFEALDKFWKWAKDSDIKTNESCGFHVGVSLPNHDKNSIDYLKLILLLGEEYVLKAFKRENNEYTESMIEYILKKVKNLWKDTKEQAFTSLKENIKNMAKNKFMQQLAYTDNRHVAVNILNNNYIEFRAAGGDYLADKEKIMNTIMRYVRAVSLAASDENTADYAKKLYKLLSKNHSLKPDAIYFFSQYVAGRIRKDELKYYLAQVRHIRQYNKVVDKADRI